MSGNTTVDRAEMAKAAQQIEEKAGQIHQTQQNLGNQIQNLMGRWQGNAANAFLRAYQDFDAQFGEWLTIANARIVRTIKARPIELLDADRAAMLPLPPVPPAVGWVNRVRLGRDYYVRIDSNDYSVDPGVIGRFVDVTADLTRVEVRHEGRLVAAHDRVWARGMTITDPAHVAAAKVLREQFQRPRPAPDPHTELVRDLADYDRAFGLIDGPVDGEEVA